jgi:predicted MPP superfamily phosphohydrolase
MADPFDSVLGIKSKFAIAVFSLSSILTSSFIYYDSLSSQDSLKILLLSDIHMALDNIELMKSWHSERNRNKPYDYVFISGDIHTIPNDGTET